MSTRRIKYENILNSKLTDFMAEKDKLIKIRETIDADFRKIIAIEITNKLINIDKIISDIQKELSIINEGTIDSLQGLLLTKEQERVYLSEVYRQLHEVVGVSVSEYINTNLILCEDVILKEKNKLELDISILKEDINKIIITEILGIKIYDIDTIFIPEEDEENGTTREIRSSEGFFFVNINDKNILVLIKDEDIDISVLELEYEKRTLYKGKAIYINIKHNIPNDKLPF